MLPRVKVGVLGAVVRDRDVLLLLHRRGRRLGFLLGHLHLGHLLGHLLGRWRGLLLGGGRGSADGDHLGGTADAEGLGLGGRGIAADAEGLGLGGRALGRRRSLEKLRRAVASDRDRRSLLRGLAADGQRLGLGGRAGRGRGALEEHGRAAGRGARGRGGRRAARTGGEVAGLEREGRRVRVERERRRVGFELGRPRGRGTRRRGRRGVVVAHWNVRARSDRAATVDTSPGLNRRKKAKGIDLYMGEVDQEIDQEFFFHMGN